ncbi:hypothetical protein F4861DRAFT_514893 [Xylaria intraflava]|nr:hypothetical protein F4861DRAFT_514893 [Xylaria intraflava]
MAHSLCVPIVLNIASLFLEFNDASTTSIRPRRCLNTYCSLSLIHTTPHARSTSCCRGEEDKLSKDGLFLVMSSAARAGASQRRFGIRALTGFSNPVSRRPRVA